MQNIELQTLNADQLATIGGGVAPLAFVVAALNTKTAATAAAVGGLLGLAADFGSYYFAR